MTEWAVILVLGVIEGITEFLPVSSTGHLLLAQYLAERQGWVVQQSDLFNTVIQCGAVLAVGALFTQRVRQLVVDWRGPASRRYLSRLAVAFVLTSAGAVLLKGVGLTLPETAGPVAWATLIGGVVIFGVERAVRKKPGQAEISWTAAVVVGLFQLVAAAFPGTSRSGATILAAMAVGVSRPAATEFSFLLGIPTLLCAGAFQIVGAWYDAHRQAVPMGEDWVRLIVASIVAAVTAFLVVRWLLRFVQTHTFLVFGWYRIALGLAILGLQD
ncbi:MAG: undecaprenyl-diphosphate phosphatase [Phycisphaerae bacterium]|nr:undecaprenyl-diphosphate phosphatase [Phycisphaerae bacterium]